MDSNNYFTSRSAYQDLLACPRLRWWRYEFLRGLPLDGGGVHVGGIQPPKQSIYTLTGTAVHEGIGHLLSYLQISKELPGVEVVDEAVELSLACFAKAIDAGGVLAPKVEEQWVPWKIQEARALAEGMVRAFVASGTLGNFHEAYEVVEVEQEDTMELAGLRRPVSVRMSSGGTATQAVPAGAIYFQARTDAILRDRSSHDINLLSIKTAAEWSWLNEAGFRRDVQGLTEAIAVEARPGWTEEHGRVAMVQMLMALKGRQYEDKARVGNYYHTSPLVSAYRKVEQFGGDQWAWSYEFPKPEGGMGRLGKGWERTPTWEYPGGVKAWIEGLAAGDIQPEAGSPWDKVFIMPEPWSRSDQAMRSMRRQMEEVEKRLVGDANGCREVYVEYLTHPSAATFDKVVEALDVRFPQNRQSCIRYGSPCTFDGVCHGGGETLVKILNVELDGPGGAGFKLREPHHSYQMGVEEV